MSKVLKAPNVVVDGEAPVKIDIGYKPETNKHDAAKQRLAEVNDIMDSARGEAQRIINKAKEDAEVIFQEAREEGIKVGTQEGVELGKVEGYEVGYSDGLKQVEDLKNDALKIVEDAKIEKEDIIDSAEVEVVEVIKDIIGNFFDCVYTIDDNVMLYLIRRGLRNATILEIVTIKVSEFDYNEVIEAIDEFKKLVDSSKKIEIVKDFNLAKSDCVIDTDFGSIDCSLKDIKNSLISNLSMILNDR